jgi:hypothetical protein
LREFGAWSSSEIRSTNIEILNKLKAENRNDGNFDSLAAKLVNHESPKVRKREKRKIQGRPSGLPFFVISFFRDFVIHSLLPGEKAHFLPESQRFGFSSLVF